jgi:hypothetical protein
MRTAAGSIAKRFEFHFSSAFFCVHLQFVLASRIYPSRRVAGSYSCVIVEEKMLKNRGKTAFWRFFIHLSAS